MQIITVASSLLLLLQQAYAEESTPEQLKLPGGDRYTGVRKFAMECFMMTLLVVVVRTIIQVRYASRMAWLWRKKKGEITSWDDLRDAPGYDMVLPAESTVFDSFFYDVETGEKIFRPDPNTNEKPKDVAEYAAYLRQKNINGIIQNVQDPSKQKEFIDKVEAQNWLHIAGQHWMNAARAGILYRARALRPLMWKVDQDYPEVNRMHDVGMCATATFEAVKGAMAMMKLEIKELNAVATEIGYLNQDLKNGPNVWNLADMLLNFRKQMEAMSEQKEEEERQEKQNQGKKKETEEQRIARMQAELIADEDREKKKKGKNKASNKRK